MSEKINELRSDITDNSLTQEDLMTILYGYGNDVLDEILLILAIIKTCNGSLKKIANYFLSKKGRPIYNFESLKNLFPSEKSDIESLFKITQKIKRYFNGLKLFRLDENDSVYNNARYAYRQIINKFKNVVKEKKSKLDPPKSLASDWDLLNKIRNEGKLDDETGFLKWLDKSDFIKREIKKDIVRNKIKISEFCESNYLNIDIILNFMDKYLDYKILIKTVNKNKDLKAGKNSFEWFDHFKNNFIYY